MALGAVRLLHMTNLDNPLVWRSIAATAWMQSETHQLDGCEQYPGDQRLLAVLIRSLKPYHKKTETEQAD